MNWISKILDVTHAAATDAPGISQSHDAPNARKTHANVRMNARTRSYSQPTRRNAASGAHKDAQLTSPHDANTGGTLLHVHKQSLRVHKYTRTKTNTSTSTYRYVFKYVLFPSAAGFWLVVLRAGKIVGKQHVTVKVNER